jgi:hypothetical protein
MRAYDTEIVVHTVTLIDQLLVFQKKITFDNIIFDN